MVGESLAPGTAGLEANALQLLPREAWPGGEQGGRRPVLPDARGGCDPVNETPPSELGCFVLWRRAAPPRPSAEPRAQLLSSPNEVAYGWANESHPKKR